MGSHSSVIDKTNKLKYSLANIPVYSLQVVYSLQDGFTLQLKMVILRVVCSLVFINTICSWLSRCQQAMFVVGDTGSSPLRENGDPDRL